MTNSKVSETRLFSEYGKNKTWTEALMKSSVSPLDALSRKTEYAEVFKRFESAKEAAKMYSGYAEVPILSNQYFNATMASYVRSFAGFLTIERNMDQPTALLWYTDTLGVTDNRVILGNIGKENLTEINSKFSATQSFDPSLSEYRISTGKKLIPGSIELNFIRAEDPKNVIIIQDDRKGKLLSPPGILIPNALGKPCVDYQRGYITFTISDLFPVVPEDKFSVSGFEDVAGNPEFGTLSGLGKNRIKMDMKSIQVVSEPDTLIAEGNLMTVAATQKSLGANFQDVASAKLTELYTKLVNGKIIDAIKTAWKGNEHIIDATKWERGEEKYMDLTSRLGAFQKELIKVDSMMAEQSVKGIGATAYVVGVGVADMFKSLAISGNFVKNTDSSYINDLLGYYNGIPVLRHVDIGVNEGYAIHKTNDGQLAPVMRGIYLPLTNTPMVGSYNNPTQFSSGIYYQEGNAPIVSELIQKFSVITS